METEKVFDIVLTLKNMNALPPIDFSQGDINSVRLNITVKDLDLTNSTIKIFIQKPSNERVYQDCEITNGINGTLTVLLTTESYNEHGYYRAELGITHGEKTVMTQPFRYVSRPAVTSTNYSKNDYINFDKYDLKPMQVISKPILAPDYIGQEAINTTGTGRLYFAKGLSEKDWVASDDSVSPDDFPGLNDFDRVQNAISYAITAKKSIRLTRMYNITNSYPLDLNKPEDRWVLRFFGNGGGFLKNNSGFMFTSSREGLNGDYYFHSVIFEGVQNVGGKCLDADNLMRTELAGCTFRNLDTVLEANPGYAQSFSFIGGRIVGGRGSAVLVASTYGVLFSGVLIEHREHFFTQIETTESHDLLTQFNVKDCLIEGLTGYGIYLLKSGSVDISGNYFEANQQGNILFAENAYTHRISLTSNNIYETGAYLQTAAIVWAGSFVSARSVSNVINNVSKHDTTLVTGGRIESICDVNIGVQYDNIDPDKVLLIESNEQKFERDEITKVDTTNFGHFTRMRTSKSIVLPPSSKAIYTFDFPVELYTDDFITVQGSADSSSNFTINSYIRNGSDKKKLNISITNHKTTESTVSIIPVILKPFFSISG